MIVYNLLLMYKIAEVNGVKTYNMSAGKSHSEFIEDAHKKHKSLRYDDEFRRRIELVQDFQFNVSTNQVEISPDQRYLIAAGTYAPQLKIYDTSELSLKCLRGIDSEVIKFKILSDDYSKIVMAQKDRSIDFHAQYGSHYKTRIPHYPRDLEFCSHNANLCISASANEVYRLSLEEGRFLTSFQTNSFINSLHFNPRLNVLACGGDQLQMWDLRQRDRVCKVHTDEPVTQVKCDVSGLLLGVGEGSKLSMFDVRFDRKLFTIRASYNEPINSIHFMDNKDKNVLFSNKKQIKVTDGQGKFYTSIEPDFAINMFTMVPGTGFILAALEEPKVGCYFIPQLGQAPKWVPYIQNITEQLEEDQSKVVYDEYKFVSKQEVYELGCQNLMNTRMLKEHMHGYLMHMRLYNKLKNKLAEVDIEERRKKRVDEMATEAKPERIAKKEIDERFALNGEDFQVNKYSEEYMLRHPHLKRQLTKEKEAYEAEAEKKLRMKKKGIHKQKKSTHKKK